MRLESNKHGRRWKGRGCKEKAGGKGVSVNAFAFCLVVASKNISPNDPLSCAGSNERDEVKKYGGVVLARGGASSS